MDRSRERGISSSVETWKQYGLVPARLWPLPWVGNTHWKACFIGRQCWSEEMESELSLRFEREERRGAVTGQKSAPWKFCVQSVRYEAQEQAETETKKWVSLSSFRFWHVTLIYSPLCMAVYCWKNMEHVEVWITTNQQKHMVMELLKFGWVMTQQMLAKKNRADHVKNSTPLPPPREYYSLH